MITYSNFKIYTRKNGFINKKSLNFMGKAIFIFFNYMKTNIYFNRINSITITSQDRKDDNTYHSDGKAIDIVIDPPPLMLYYGGILSACYSFNILFGSYKTNEKNNLHLHIDSTSFNGINKKQIEITIPKKLVDITFDNIDSLLDLYDFSFLESIQNFGKFKNETKYLLLTKFNKNDKKEITFFIRESLEDKIRNLMPEIDFPDWIKLSLGIIGLYFFSKIYKNFEVNNNGGSLYKISDNKIRDYVSTGKNSG